MKKTLKLILLAVLLFVVMLVFTACGNSEEDISDEEVENKSSSAVSENEEENEEEGTDEEDSSNLSSSRNRVLDQADEMRDETTIAFVNEQVEMALADIKAKYLEELGNISVEYEEYIEENLEDQLGSDYKVNFIQDISVQSTKNCEIEYEGETYLFSISVVGYGITAEYAE